MTIAKFEIGKTYKCRLITNSEQFVTAEIIARTEKTVTAAIDGTWKIYRVKPLYDNSAEHFMPWGRYSMAPMIRAA